MLKVKSKSEQSSNNQEMPESPEVRLTTDYLEDAMVGRTVVNWGFVNGKHTDETPEGFEEFEQALPLKVISMSCKGKFIYGTFSNDKTEFYMLHSLMMTGGWRTEYDDFCKWYVELEGADLPDETLWFRDPRALGTLRFTSDRQVLQDKLDSLGPDIMKPEFTLPKFKELLMKYKNRNICSFLMAQDIIAGCGNYIKCESLYSAKISPMRKAGSLTEDEQEELYSALRIIPRESYNNKGVSIRDFTDENGMQGYHASHLKVYGKKDAKRAKTADGRTTYWYPTEQV